MNTSTQTQDQLKKISIPLIVNYINLISALLTVEGFIFRESPFVRIVMYIFFTSYVLEFFSDKKYKKFTWDRSKYLFLSMIILFLLAFIRMPFEHSNEFRSVLLERRLSLLGFGIIGMFGTNNLFKFKYFLYAFITSSILAIIVVFTHLNISEFIQQSNRSDLFTEARITYVNSHMKFNFYLNISLISIWYLIKKHWNSLTTWKIIFVAIGLTLIMYVLSITEGRSGFIAGVLLILSFVFIELINRWKAIGVISIFLLPLLLVIIVSNQRRMTEDKVEHEPRIFLWQSAVNLIEKKPIFGYGISDGQIAFNAERIKNQDKNFEIYSTQHKIIDSHDQYLQTALEFGIPALIILLFIYIYPLFISDKRRRYFTIFVISLCLFQSVFDMFLTGTFSVIFGILMIMIFQTQTEYGFSLNEVEDI